MMMNSVISTQNANNCNKCNRLPTPVQPKPMQLGRQPTSLIGVLRETKFRHQIYCECECQGYVLIPNLDIVLHHLCLWMRPEFMCPGFLQGLSKVSQGFLKGCLKDLKTGQIQAAYFHWLCYIPMTRTGRRATLETSHNFLSKIFSSTSSFREMKPRGLEAVGRGF